MKNLKRKAGLIAVAGAALLLSSCGFKTPSDMVAVQVGAGPFEASKVKGCKAPSQRDFFYQTNDDYKYFPTSEREWEATGQDGSDAGRFKVVTNDNVEMYIPVTVRFSLITDCDTLTEFYTKYARRYGAEFDSDGSYNKEWITLLRKLVANPADASADRIAQNYNWRDLWNDPGTKAEFERSLDESLAGENSLLVQTAQGTYFEDISILVGKPEPVNEELAQAVAAEQTAVATAKSKEAQAQADKAAAEAQVAVSKAEARKKAAEIEGFGSVENYLKYLCLTQQENCNPYQPTYVVGLPNAK